MIKSFLSYCIIVIIVFQTCLSGLLIINSIKSHKKNIKSICKEIIKQDNYKANLVKFTEQELEKAIWEHSKEFFLGGSKYDVVTTEIINGIKIYHCIDDKKEIELKAKIAQQQSNKIKFDELIKKMNLSYISLTSNLKIELNKTSNKTDFYKNEYHFLFNGDISKPPKVIVLS